LNSSWYVFWHVAGTDDKPLLAIWHNRDGTIPVFLETEVLSIKKQCKEQLKKGTALIDWQDIQVPREEIEELLGYIDEWLEDLKNERNRRSIEGSN
jgi:hypothetical protein